MSIPDGETQNNPVETAPRVSDFLSLVVVERLLTNLWRSLMTKNETTALGLTEASAQSRSREEGLNVPAVVNTGEGSERQDLWPKPSMPTEEPALKLG